MGNIGANIKKHRELIKYTVESKYYNWRKKGSPKNGVERKVIKTLSQKDLASETGFAQSTISNYEDGSIIPTIPNLLRLCDYFGCTPNDLLKGEYKESKNE